ncbi:Serpin-ZX [Platanthera guangdongensis]|uniref:Serpin-ZX n=1 Tax=Platanthera guangdongensis TaxID=2320717 RepID=A0ABR2LG36_9ASPA
MTKFKEFYLLDGSMVQAPFMSSIKRQFISTSDTFTVVKLPYKQQLGGHLINKLKFSMLFFSQIRGTGFMI